MQVLRTTVIEIATFWCQRRAWFLFSGKLQILKGTQADARHSPVGMLKRGFKCCTGGLGQLLSMVPSHSRILNFGEET